MLMRISLKTSFTSLVIAYFVTGSRGGAVVVVVVLVVGVCRVGKRCGADTEAIWKDGGSWGPYRESRLPPHTHTPELRPASVYGIYMCMCVSERERERETRADREGVGTWNIAGMERACLYSHLIQLYMSVSEKWKWSEKEKKREWENRWRGDEIWCHIILAVASLLLLLILY